MNAQQLLAKIKAYPLALALFGLAILLGGWDYYRSGALEEANGHRDTVAADNDQISKNVTDSVNLDAQLAQLTADAATLKAGFINPAAVIPNQQYFYDFEQSTGVQILDPSEESTTRGKDPAEPSVTTFRLSAAGTWENLISFLYALQSGPHLMRFTVCRIEKVSTLRSTGTDTQRLNLILTVELLGQ